MTGVGKFHYLERSGVITDLTAGAAPTVQPPTDGLGFFVILQDGSSDKLDFRFTDFINDISTRLNADAKARDIAAAWYCEIGSSKAGLRHYARDR